MKISQKPSYNPITVKFETREEAAALLGIMDKVCACYAHEGADITPAMLSKDERALAVKISDAFTECKVSV